MRRRPVAILVLFALTALFQPAAAEEPHPGQAGYEKRCAMCHGKNGVAKKMAEGSANLNDPEWQARTSLEEVIRVISEGVGTMKGMKSKLTEEEIKAIAEYTLTLE